MATISFRAKVGRMYNMDDTLAYEDIKIPRLTRAHCDMAAMRVHPTLGAYANSDMFDSILVGVRKRIFGEREFLRLDRVPDGVHVDTSKFMAVVSFEV